MPQRQVVRCPRCGRRGIRADDAGRLGAHRLPFDQLADAERLGFTPWPFCVLALDPAAVR